METNPLVSVIVPTYNRDTYLLQAIESIVNQTYKNVEVLVIDDGSSIKYAEGICERFQQCHYHHKTNGGVSSARNAGIALAKGDFIAFLDDDDFWKEDKLEKQLGFLSKNPDIDLVHGPAIVVDESGKPTGKTIGASKEKAHKRSGYVFWNAIGTWIVKAPTPLIRKKVFTPHMRFDETLVVGEDTDFYQRLFYNHKITYLEEPLAYYRDFGDAVKLSKLTKKYIGIEGQMLANFKKMGVTHPLTLHRISIHLVKQAIRNWNSAYPENPKKISKWNLCLRPVYCLENYFKHSV